MHSLQLGMSQTFATRPRSLFCASLLALLGPSACTTPERDTDSDQLLNVNPVPPVLAPEIASTSSMPSAVADLDSDGVSEETQTVGDVDSANEEDDGDDDDSDAHRRSSSTLELRPPRRNPKARGVRKSIFCL